MQNEQLTWLQDPGAVTEVLSGEFYQPLGRSSSHQLWSSAMVLTPAIRGLFGIEADVLTGRLRVDPQLPADWSQASLRNVPFGDTQFNLQMHRVGPNLEVEATSQKPIKLCLQNSKDFFAGVSCNAAGATSHRLRLPLPEVEVGLEPSDIQPGDRTEQAKFIGQKYGPHSLQVRLEVMPGKSVRLYLRNSRSVRNLRVQGAQRDGDWLTVKGNGSAGYSEHTIEIAW
jgi:hypothetical protein